MRRLLTEFKRTFLSKKFIGYCLIGIVNTFNTAFFSWLAHLKIQENIAAYIGYFVSLTINYILNSIIVFKNRLNLRRYLRFLLSYVPNFVIYTLVSLLTINVMQLNQFWATVLATAAGAPITFVIIKLFAFGNRAK
ncbi:MAG: GtrA family protein [Acutalibacteraceae bacterium]